METVLLRCQSCGTVNRVAGGKLSLKPKCGRCKTVIDYPNRPVDVTASSFHHEVLSCPGAVLVDFWSPSCGHCQRLNPLLDQIAAEKAGMLKVVKINTQTEQFLAGQFGIRGVPTLILYKGGKKLRELPGALPKEQLDAWIGGSL
ncbi:MAG: thioredoxin fold domain-containing protein [Nitrospiraceae bacterium]|nr:MAG: thioredoxin fold domain-containing protein [Nitrospiraceae bacterium]